jgi:predicted AAA+ superfamily ATPase
MSIGSASKITVKVKKKPKVFVNQSGMVTRRLNDLADVNIDAKEDGSLLIYDEQQEQFVASRLLDKQEINGGHF